MDSVGFSVLADECMDLYEILWYLCMLFCLWCFTNLLFPRVSTHLTSDASMAPAVVLSSTSVMSTCGLANTGRCVESMEQEQVHMQASRYASATTSHVSSRCLCLVSSRLTIFNSTHREPYCLEQTGSDACSCDFPSSYAGLRTSVLACESSTSCCRRSPSFPSFELLVFSHESKLLDRAMLFQAAAQAHVRRQAWMSLVW